MTPYNECELNKEIAEIFIPEYQSITGKFLNFYSCGDPFPDVLMIDSDKESIGMELVSLVFPWVPQDERAFNSYVPKFLGILKEHRPLLKGLWLSFQYKSEKTIVGRRDSEGKTFLPRVDSNEGRILLDEFTLFVKEYKDILKNPGAILFSEIVNPKTGEPKFFSLLEYFDALSTSLFEGDLPDGWNELDPFIKNRVIMFDRTEVVQSVERAVQKKYSILKGLSYSCEFLLIHTPFDYGFFPTSLTMYQEIVNLIKKEITKLPQELKSRFDEVWFLEIRPGSNKLEQIY